MRVILTIYLLVFVQSIGSTQLHLDFNYNLDLIKKYNSSTQKMIEKGLEVNSSTYTTSMTYDFYTHKKLVFSEGITFKRVNYKVQNIYRGISIYEYNNSQTEYVDTTILLTNIDYLQNLNSFALKFDLKYNIYSTKQSKAQLGFIAQLYLLSFYHKEFVFEKKDVEQNANSYGPSYRVIVPYWGPIMYKRKLSTSSLDFQIYYRYLVQIFPQYSLAARISIGTNLYSDWDQFKKYAWLGVGLEMGFGQVKQLGKKVTD